MPIQPCTKIVTRKGKKVKVRGFKFGEHGTCYLKREDALRQMRAMFASGYRGR